MILKCCVLSCFTKVHFIYLLINRSIRLLNCLPTLKIYIIMKTTFSSLSFCTFSIHEYFSYYKFSKLIVKDIYLKLFPLRLEKLFSCSEHKVINLILFKETNSSILGTTNLMIVLFRCYTQTRCFT